MADKPKKGSASELYADEPDQEAWLKEALRPIRGAYRELLVLSLFVNLLALAVPIFSMQVYDRIISSSAMTTLGAFVIGMMIVVLFDFILKQTRSRIMQRSALRIDVEIGQQLFNKILALPLAYLEAKPNNFWTALFRDIEVVRNTRSGPSAVLLTDLPFAFLFIGVIIAIAAPILWVLAVMLPAFIFLAWRSAATLNSANDAERKVGFDRDALIAEMVAGRATVKALALEESIRPLWEERHAASIKEMVVRGRKSDSYSNFTQILTVLTTIAMTGVGAIAIMNQDMTVGALISANMLVGRVLGPFNQLVGSWRNYAAYRMAVKRLSELFAMPSERQDKSIDMGRPRGEITLENVIFGYKKEGQPVIDDLRMTIKPNSFTTVMGPNGAGKTTLVKLLLGLYRPTQGRVLLDGADMTQFTRREIANWISYVPQEIFLFSGSIRENIAKSHPDASDDDVIRAAKMAGVHPFLIDLPDGYSTDIGEAGRLLPGGLRQRLTIARAFVGDPPVLIMDEPSSNLDRDGEQELCRILQTLARDHTVIVITHSMALLAASQEIVVMQKGKVIRQGPPDVVLAELSGRKPVQAPAAMRGPREGGVPALPAPDARPPLPPRAVGAPPRPPEVRSAPVPPAAAQRPAPQAAPRPAPVPQQAAAPRPAPQAPRPQAPAAGAPQARRPAPAPVASPVASNVQPLRPPRDREAPLNAPRSGPRPATPPAVLPMKAPAPAAALPPPQQPQARRPAAPPPRTATPQATAPVAAPGPQPAAPAPAGRVRQAMSPGRQQQGAPAAAPARAPEPATPLDAAARRRLAAEKQAQRSKG